MLTDIMALYENIVHCEERADRSKESDATSISFQTVTTVEAGQPYFLKLPETQTEDIVNPTFEGVTSSRRRA